tara:strand:- start:358 stop:1542 length:1185 start_codon:yes stop_codon:yes gene_type:complete
MMMQLPLLLALTMLGQPSPGAPGTPGNQGARGERGERGQRTPAERFDRMDRNKDGVLTRDELPRPQIFIAMDADKDGKVTREEAEAWGKANPRSQRNRRGNRQGNAPDGGNAPMQGEEPRRRTTPAAEPTRNLKDIVYVEQPSNAKRQSLDIHKPDGAGPHPVLVHIHGGGWAAGDKKNNAQAKAKVLDDIGWMLVTPNYRLSPEVQHPGHIIDVAAAVAWVHDNIADYGGDPERIVVMGHSAGAHLAALVATDHERLAVHGKSPRILDGVILLDGAAYDIPTTMSLPTGYERMQGMHRRWVGNDRSDWIDASPMLQVTADVGTPPFLILHTARAEATAISTRLGEALQRAGCDALVLECPDDDHGSINTKLGQPDHRPTEAIRIVLESINEPK